jgi:hypothetical protein
MDNSKKYLDENGYDDRISFSDGKTHTVKLLKDKEGTIPGPRGDVKGMKYLVEEDGKQKSFFTSSLGLVSKLALCSENDVVSIHMGKANNKSFYTVVKADGAEVKVAGSPELDEEEAVPASPEW